MTLTQINENEVSSLEVHENCPLYSENPPFNETTLAAMQEAKDIASGKIPGKWHNSIEEAREEFFITGTHSDLL